jgi:telomerase reverse transcriptase
VKPDEFKDTDSRKRADNARCLAKYVFPRQYGLSSPFLPGPGSKQDGFKFPDYLDRSREIEVQV